MTWGFSHKISFQHISKDPNISWIKNQNILQPLIFYDDVLEKAIVFCFILILFCEDDTDKYTRKNHCFSGGFLCLAKTDVTKNSVIQSRNTREKYFALFVERIAVHGIN